MSYNTKNHTEQGGEKTVIGGEIEITGTLHLAEGANLEGVLDAAAATVINDLTTGGTTDALSAEQGKALKTLVDARVPITAIIDALTSTSAVVPLSAKQGKALKDALDLKTAANQAANATAAATSEATGWALTNQLKTDFNALLVKLKAAGLMVAD